MTQNAPKIDTKLDPRTPEIAFNISRLPTIRVECKISARSVQPHVPKMSFLTSVADGRPASISVWDGLYIRMRFHLRVYRVSDPEKRQKEEKWALKILKMDPNR
jgi:hypothetical protein